jgi:MFS family permease
MTKQQTSDDLEVKKALKSFYTISTFWSAFFATANWFFFWRIFLSSGKIGLVDSICFLVGMIAQIPTGAIADKIGRRQTMILGTTLMGLGYGFTGLASSGIDIFIGYLVYSVGSSFYSGADDAYMYDYLKAKNLEGTWETVARRKQMFGRISYMLAIFIGGYLYIANVRLPSIARGIVFLLAVIPLIYMKFMDRYQPTSIKGVTTTYGKHIWTGMKEVLNKRMLSATVLILIIQGVTVSMFIGGILRPLMLQRSGLPINDQSNFLVLVSIPLTIFLFRKIKRGKLSVYSRAILWSVCILAGFLLNISVRSFPAAIAGIVLILFGNYLLVPVTSKLINDNASSRHRATALSTAGLLEDIPYVIAGPLIGLAADRNEFTLVIKLISVFIALSILISLFAHKKYSNIEALA